MADAKFSFQEKNRVYQPAWMSPEGDFWQRYLPLLLTLIRSLFYKHSAEYIHFAKKKIMHESLKNIFQQQYLIWKKKHYYRMLIWFPVQLSQRTRRRETGRLLTCGLLPFCCGSSLRERCRLLICPPWSVEWRCVLKLSPIFLSCLLCCCWYQKILFH